MHIKTKINEQSPFLFLQLTINYLSQSSPTPDWTAAGMLTTRMSVRRDGQWSAGAICLAKESVPSCRSPIFHSTKPPYILRHALPEPCLNTGKQTKQKTHSCNTVMVVQVFKVLDYQKKLTILFRVQILAVMTYLLLFLRKLR